MAQATLPFLSTLSLRRATAYTEDYDEDAKFLSTLSLRRATDDLQVTLQDRDNFYPRSPCGERLSASDDASNSLGISIHALLAESDLNMLIGLCCGCFISIHALLAESDVTVLGIQHKVGISIHALLAESDCYSLRHSA